MFGTPNQLTLAGRHRRVAGLVIATALLAAACGDTDDDATTASTETTAAMTATTTASSETTAATTTTDLDDATDDTTADTMAEDGEPTTPDTAASGPRLVEHRGGTTEVPADVERLVVLDDYAGFVVLELGVEPDTIYGSYYTESLPRVAGLSGIEVTPFSVEEPSIEAVAAVAPDLIIASDHPGTVRNYDLWAEIAPTVLIDYAGAWQDQIDVAARALGTDDEAAARIAALDGEIDRVAQRIADELDAPPTASIIGSLQQMPFSIPATGTATGELLQRLGIERPDAQQVEADPAFPFTFFSPELLPEQDADFVLSAGGGIYEDMTTLDLWPTLTGTTAVVTGDEWLATHPFGIWWMLADIEALLFEEGTVGTAEDAADRWNRFLALGS